MGINMTCTYLCNIVQYIVLTVKQVGGGSSFMRTTAAGGTGNTPPGTGCSPGAEGRPETGSRDSQAGNYINGPRGQKAQLHCTALRFTRVHNDGSGGKIFNQFVGEIKTRLSSVFTR